MNETKILLTLNPETTALILIDLQKGIIAMPTEPISSDRVIHNAQKLVDIFHQAKSQVILVRVSGSSDGKDMLHPQADDAMMRKGELPKDWANIVPELMSRENDLINSQLIIALHKMSS